MAKVIPYGCATAHGKVNNSIAFRRHNCKTYLMKNPKPGYTDTPAQQQPRQDMRDAVQRYQLRNFSEKTFLDKRSKEVPGNQYSLFIRKYMKDQIWSRVRPVGVTTIENMVIQNPVGSELANAIISIEAIATSLEDLDCLLWNKLGSNDEVEDSPIGDDGIISGTIQYMDAKFWRGIYNVSPANYITFPVVHAFNEGIIDHWWIPDFSSTDTNFNSVDIIVVNSIPGTERLYLIWWANYGGIQDKFFMYGWRLGIRCQYYFNPLPFAADEKVHLEFIINYSKGNGLRYKMLQNGTELSIYSIPHDNPIVYTEEQIQLLGMWNPAGNKAIIDNIKAYPKDTYAAQIGANREYENFSPDPLVIGTYGHVIENSNIFVPGEDIEDAPAQRIAIENIGGYDLQIPFRYYVAVTWSGPGVSSRTSLIRFPEMTIPTGKTAYLYLAEDWSTYYDKELRNLACTNKM